MDIIIVGTDPYCLRPGGIEAYERNLISGAIEHGINVTWLNNKLEINKHDQRFDSNSLKNENISGFKFLYLLFFKVTTFKINKSCIIHAQRPDFLLPFILFNIKNPKICTLHGQNSRGITLKKGKFIGALFKFIEGFVLSRTRAIIAVDESTKNYYESLYPWLKNRISIIPIGINLKIFKPLDVSKVRQKFNFNLNDKIILYLGRFEQEKNLDLIIKSFKELKKEIPSGKLLLVGEGREKIRIENLVIEMCLKDVFFINTIESDLVPELLNCADVLIITSNYESGPLVALESIACGIPIVTTDVGRVREFIKNEFVGKIVDRNEKNVANAILELFSADKEKIKKECREAAQYFAFETTIYETIEIYKNIKTIILN